MKVINAKDVDFEKVVESTEITNIQKIETEIIVLKEQIAGNFIQIGQKLIQAKEEVEYGQWGNWLKEKVDFSERQARQLMQISRECKEWQAPAELGQTKVFSLLALPQEEREDFIENNPVEEMTTRELEQAIRDRKKAEQEKEEAENTTKQLAQKLGIKDEVIKRERLERERVQEEYEKLKQREPERVEVPVPTAPMDYYHLKESNAKLEQKIVQLSRAVEDKEMKIENTVKEKEILEKKAKLNEEESEKYKDMKNQIDFLYKQKSDLSRQIESATELSGLAVKIDNFLKTELAPIRYSRVFERMDSEVARENLLEILHKVDQWSFEIKQLIPNEYRKVDVYHE